jgi:hypothetical protein
MGAILRRHHRFLQLSHAGRPGEAPPADGTKADDYWSEAEMAALHRRARQEYGATDAMMVQMAHG